jgi:peptidoglycan/xylan/chitin deacetylase (PgdA/CDA1 family)
MKEIYVTVDVEEDVPPYLKNSFTGIERGLPHLLELLKRKGISATFFITGNIAQRFPETVEAILKDHHEIGCHSFRHKPLTNYLFNNEYKQRKDIEKGTNTLESLTGRRPILFRAPEFSVNKITLRILEELDYQLDSSVLPGRKYRRLLRIICSHKNAPEIPYHPSAKDHRKKGGLKLLEVPVTRCPLTQRNPFGMGTINYHGLKKAMNFLSIIKQEKIIFLIHTWECVNLSTGPTWAQKCSSSSGLNKLMVLLNAQQCRCLPLTELLK